MGSGWGRIHLYPENLQGLLPRQNLLSAASRSLLELSPEQLALGLVHMTRLPFRDAREKGPGRTLLLSFFQQNDRLPADTRPGRWHFKGFSGAIWGGYNYYKPQFLTKPEGLLPSKKRSKTNSTVFLRDNVFKKKKKKSPG